MHDFQIGPIPAWVSTVKFDIAAKAEQAVSSRVHPATTDDDTILQARLRNLLPNRFHLQLHRETKDKPVIELAVDHPESKMRVEIADTGYSVGPGNLKCSDSSMSVLASILSDYLNVVVLDRTGLAGGYQFSLTWKPQQRASQDDERPELPTALREQLGLNSVRSNGLVDLLVVDHIERPSTTDDTEVLWRPGMCGTGYQAQPFVE